MVVLVITGRCERAPRLAYVSDDTREEGLIRLVGSFPEARLVLGEAAENICVGG